tara:strand:+ start:2146 stop:2709 length:564 start_codon:yes stop_codon:yes gene_type:complete
MQLLKYLYFLTHVCALVFNNKYYVSSKHPQNDLRVLSAAQSSSISRIWYNKIMTNFFDAYSRKNVNPMDIARDFKHSPYNHIISHINTLESLFNTPKKDKYLYMGWMPKEIDTNEQNEVLSLVVCEKNERDLCLTCIVPNPCWTSTAISYKELKKSLLSLEDSSQILNVTHFFEDSRNIRLKLDWFF